MTSESSNTAALVERLRNRALALRAGLAPSGRHGLRIHDACLDTEAADALSALAEELEEARVKVGILEALTVTPLFSHRALTAKLYEIIATRFGVRFMAPPDGGDVPAHDQVERMADALQTAERQRDEALAAFKASEAREAELRIDRDSWRRVAERLEEEKQALRTALEPLGRLEIPARPQGNAGAYSIRHDDIRRARAALSTKEMGS